jgi:hypothetical protein
MIMALARERGRTVYDAGYLELALRLVIPSRPWTLPWPRAAPVAGVELLTA